MSREDQKLQYYIQLFERQAAAEEKRKRRREAKAEKKAKEDTLPKRTKYQGKKCRKPQPTQSKPDTLKIELVKEHSGHAKILDEQVQVRKVDVEQTLKVAQDTSSMASRVQSESVKLNSRSSKESELSPE